MSASLARRLPLLLLPLLLFSTGCLPGIDWLPDSSGFVYSGGRGKKQLMLFDVKTKKSKALSADAVGNTWPSVSPDGKKVAAAVRSQRGGTAYVTVRVFGRDGKLLHRSKDIEWKAKAKGKEKDEPQVVQAAWSPDGDKLLLADVLRTAIYDLKTTKVTFVEGLVLTFGNRPIRPDGKGAVTYGQEKFNWVDWSGKAQAINVKLPEEKKGKADPEGDALMMLFPLLFDSKWEGKVARVAFGEGDLRLDTGKLTGEMRPEKKDGPGTVRQSHTFPGGTVVRIVETKKDGGLEGPLALEVVKPGGKELLSRGPKVMKLYPSPDGRLVAVRYSEDFEALFTDRKSDRILVLDSAGKKLADFPVAE
jgi:hypothetical protein